MPIVQPLKVLDIDGQKQLVEEMSPEVQQAVATYNEWNQDLADARVKHAQMQAAVQMAHNALSEIIKKEYAEAAAAAGAEAGDPAPEPAPALDAEAEAKRVVAAERAAEAQKEAAAAQAEKAATGNNFGLDEQKIG